MATLKDIDKLVDMSVKHYRTDWYKHDRPRAEKDDHFVISLRDMGVDTLFLGCEKSYGNMMWIKACLDSERALAIYEYNKGEITLISHERAKEILAQAKESCPDGYIEECERLWNERKPQPTVKEYLEEEVA